MRASRSSAWKLERPASGDAPGLHIRIRARKSATGRSDHSFSFIPRSSTRLLLAETSGMRATQGFRGQESGYSPGLADPTPDLCSLPFFTSSTSRRRDLSLERQRPETQAANAELAQKAAWPSAELAPVVLAAAELRLSRVFHSLCSSCHKPLKNKFSVLRSQFSVSSSALLRTMNCALRTALTPLAGTACRSASKRLRLLSSLAVVQMVMFMPSAFQPWSNRSPGR